MLGLLGTTRVPLPNGISLRPAALAGCTGVTDRQTNGRTYKPRADTSVAVGGIVDAFSDAA